MYYVTMRGTQLCTCIEKNDLPLLKKGMENSMPGAVLDWRAATLEEGIYHGSVLHGHRQSRDTVEVDRYTVNLN